MNTAGLVIGIATFLLIGIFHPIVIKSEYYFGVKCWPFFAVCGVIGLVSSLFIRNDILSAVVAVLGISCLWSILELFEQRERVRKGWFPSNPNKSK
ncbi:MAG: DUF4491 family protein [Paludibacteraceae bacterium]|nr:DUF4491 family protein [Paludibacteraceae bacterium]